MILREQVDFHLEFKKWYLKIINDFGFEQEKDCQARDVLSQILKEKSESLSLERILNRFKRMIQGNSNILIYGCGPTLEESVEKLLLPGDILNIKNNITLAADGAAVLLREKDIHIHGIFTDLDGITKEEFEHTDFMIVHAHGDNIAKLKYFKENLIDFENIIGTSQCEPLKNILNPGGFTDGDRILFFLRTFLTDQKIYLIGMDFNDVIGKYSKPEMNENKEGNPIKLKKLKYAMELLEWLIPHLHCELYFVNSGISSDKFQYITIEEFKELVR